MRPHQKTNMLSNSGYFQVMDQTRHGISSNERDAGEVDLLLKKNVWEAAIFEGLKLDSVNSQYIKNHIDTMPFLIKLQM